VETRSERLETRLRPSDKEFIAQAASLEGVPVSDFSRDHLMEAATAAHRRLGSSAQTMVPDEFFAELMDALNAPAKPNARAAAAQRRLERVVPAE
jgi:uncharacterized protein (DUF1778 family)